MIATVVSASGNRYKIACQPNTPARVIMAMAARVFLERMVRVVRRERL